MSEEPTSEADARLDELADRVKSEPALMGAICRLMVPHVAKWARTFRPRLGTMQEDDLCQVGQIAVIKAAMKYDRTRGQSFVWWSWRPAVRAMKDQLRSRGQDVCRSEGDDRGRTKKPAEGRPLNVSCDYALEEADETTPEQLVTTAELVRELRKHLPQLSSIERQVVKALYGVGEAQVSGRALAWRMNIPRSRLDRIAKDALERLRELMEDET